MPVTRENVEAAMNEASRFLERAQYYLDYSSRSGFVVIVAVRRP